MADAIDEVEGIMGIAAIAVILLLVWYLANKLLDLFGSSPDTGAYPNSPLSPLQNVNGVSGVAALLQRGISYFAGQPANQIFGPNATGIASDTWWNRLWQYFDPLPPQTALDYSQAVDSFDESGLAGAAAAVDSSSPDVMFGPPPATQNFINSMGFGS